MRGVLTGMFGMGVMLTMKLNTHMREAVRASAGRKVPPNTAINRAAALGMLTAWAMMARAKRDAAYYSRLGM